MIYPFMTLEDGTEVVHSERKEDGSVKVYIEKPVELGFHSVECWLPRYEWKNNQGFSEKELAYFDEFVHSLAHVILELSEKGGFDNASKYDNERGFSNKMLDLTRHMDKVRKA